MVCQKVKIKNPAGLHLRPAGKLCDEAIKYKSKISFPVIPTNRSVSLIQFLPALLFREEQ